jgi:hypothetical protein
MINIDISIAVYSELSSAMEAVRLLMKAGVSVRALSIVGKEAQMAESLIDFSCPGEGVGVWGERCVCVRGTAVLGNFGAFVISACETLIEGPSFGAVDAAFTRLGVSEDRAQFYENELECGCFLLIARCTLSRRSEIEAILQATNPWTLDVMPEHRKVANVTHRYRENSALESFMHPPRPVIHVAQRY